MADKKEPEIVYLKHPVTPEEKAKHKGKRILDAKFKPADEKAEAKAKTKAAGNANAKKAAAKKAD